MINVPMDASAIGCRVTVAKRCRFQSQRGRVESITYKVTIRPDGPHVNERAAAYGVKMDSGPFIWFRCHEINILRVGEGLTRGA